MDYLEVIGKSSIDFPNQRTVRCHFSLICHKKDDLGVLKGFAMNLCLQLSAAYAPSPLHIPFVAAAQSL